MKFNLLFYKTVLDIIIVDFFNDYNNFFQNINGNYVLADGFNENIIFKYFKTKFLDLLNKNANLNFDRLNPSFYIIINDCLPKNNILLKFKKQNYFPEKLNKLINSDFQIKYVLKEKDIKIDYIKFNDIFNNVFDWFFKQKNLKSNVIFLQHTQLDCYTIFKIIKSKYGKKCCINMYKEIFNDIKQPLVSFNELIDKYVFRSLVKNDSEYTIVSNELMQYMQERLSNI